ncbi:MULTISPECIES: helix-hairpin-helix domain-containing protein [Paenibacillus]|uniref:helix-hairpin-helix domain-containing protein n=1 Tax=Paenibacillus TaxID=44249 RepID=UPI0022B8DAFF|nr:helix-hairpin-helix domain-containing protein [Paenibacillus caseinilyticus]MCZ8518675.1 helix-hairpin-helix domain-containing protein [Paenibacillus caseinilyticus]
MLRHMHVKTAVLAVLLAGCGLLLMLGVAKTWSTGEKADGFVAADDEMRRLLDEAAAPPTDEKSAQEAAAPPADGKSAQETASAAADGKPSKGAASVPAGGQSAKAAASSGTEGGSAEQQAGVPVFPPPKPGQPGVSVDIAGGSPDSSAAAVSGKTAVTGTGTAPPAADQAPAAVSPGGASAAQLHLNQATAEQLDALPGIGPSRAAAIIELRKKRGGAFRSLDELLEVKGIGEKSLQKLKPLLTL